MKKSIIILSVVLALAATTFTGCITIVSPEGDGEPGSPPKVSEPEVSLPPYTEMQFSVTHPEIYRINIFADEGAIIEGEWKSDKCVYTWYTNPGEFAYSLSAHSDLGGKRIPIMPPTGDIDVPTYDHDDRRWPIYACTGDTLSYIKTTPPEGWTGYYTFCFMPDRQQTANIIVRYRVR